MILTRRRSGQLKGPEGKTRTIKVDPSVKRLKEVKKGDQVVLRYTEAVAISVRKPWRDADKYPGHSTERSGEMADKKPNILVIWGDDIGITNLSCYSDGLMGYRTPNIDRIAKEGMRFTDCYGEQSCTAGRASFITGQSGFRTGLTKVGIPASPVGLQAEDPTIAELLKNHGYATGQFGKNHLGDLNKYLPTVHGFDEFFGNLYHLNAEEEPEMPDYPPEKDSPSSTSSSGLGGCCTAGPPTRTTRPSSRAGAGWASSESRTPAR